MLPQRSHLRLGRLVVVLASVALALGAGEVLQRRSHARKVARLLHGRTEADLLTRATDDERIYELRPSTRLANAHGFRDGERTLVKPPGTFRIAAIGDSVTMQAEIAPGDLYPSVLERLLAERRPGTRVEVLNFGVTGYGPRQELALLRARVLAFSPDLVLWQFHDNDGADPTRANADGGLATFYVRPRSRLLFWAERRFDRWARARFVARERLQGVRAELVEQLRGWDEVGAIFGDVARETAARGLPVYVFLYPSWPDGSSWERYSERGVEIHDRLADRFRGLGFEALDLLPLLAAEDPSSLRVSPDDPWHPSARGHRWIAARLADWLLRDGPAPLGGRPR